MGANTAELIDTSEKRDERGRRIGAARHRAQLLAVYAQSGLTQRAFAEREGIKYHTFVDWPWRERQNSAPRKSGPRFQELRLGPVGPPRGTLEVVLPNGLVVRGGGSTAAVAELVRALQDTPRC